VAATPWLERDGLGLRLPSDLDFAAWQELGVKLGRVSSASTWALADWTLFGSRTFKHGAKYEKAIEATGLAYATLRNYASIAARFPLERRRPELTFAHHAAVARLDEKGAARILEHAAEYQWSVSRIRQAAGSEAALRSRSQRLRIEPPGDVVGGGPLVAGADEEVESLQLTIGLSLEREQRWKAAAHSAGMSLRDWLVELGDTAAASAQGAGGTGQPRNVPAGALSAV
jgi:hypothetical protein